MDEQRLAAIRERADKAPPAKWFLLRSGDSLFVEYGDEMGSYIEVLNENDGRFIAHARQDVPWLLDALAAREAEVARYREALTFYAEGRHFFVMPEEERVEENSTYLEDDGGAARAALAAPPPGAGAGGGED